MLPSGANAVDAAVHLPESLSAHYQQVLGSVGLTAGRLLDVGCGAGRFLRLAAQSGVRVAAGIETRRRVLPAPAGFWLAVGDGQQLPFNAHSFDLVTLMETLEWVGDRVQALREAARVCAPAGRVIADDTDWDTVVFSGTNEALGRRILRSFCDSGPAGWIGRATPALMRRAGLEDITCEAHVLVERAYERAPTVTGRPA